ncbi:MAG: hypothetical protein DWQ02_01795 [Bacteroidetes bacterium]|nr:MAG: hypothetical protein DWQ02_01795 [Bacteroidota bacterium]
MRVSQFHSANYKNHIFCSQIGFPWIRIVSIFILIFTINFSLTAQNCCDVDEEVDLCYLSGADYCGSNLGTCFGYSLDGTFMVNALTAKLTSPDNFGPDGIVDCELELIELEDVSSVQAINDAGCDIIFLPNVFIEPGTEIMDLSQSFIPEEILQNIYDWSLLCSNNLVIATQGEANLWGYITTNSNVNPNTPIPGTSLNSIFEGAFGSLNSFNQGGSFQGVFTSTPPATDYEVLAHDANNNPTVVLDLVSNDIIVGDIGIFCSGGAGVVSAGSGINNNNDILICNIFALACELAQEANKVTVTHELCPGESVVLPDGIEVNTAGIYIDTLTAFNGCDSIITTSLAYGIEESPIFPEPDTTICEGDTISIDGTLPINFPVPLFENNADVVIDPIFVNVVSEMPITGFGSTILGPGMIESICFDIDHTWLDDLDILLIAPNGNILELSTDNGLNNDDYIGTCFTEDATQVIGSAGTGAPFTGNYLPEGDWSDLYGSEINGTWQLVLQDDANGFVGTLLNWSITFSPILDLSYHWETNNGLSCDDCPVTDAFPVQSTTYFLTMTDSYGCSTLDSTTIAVIPSLPAPDVSCDSITLNSINISWESVSGASGYQVNINEAGWISPNDGTLGHLLDGLSPLDTIEIMVQAFDECGGQITSLTCSTPDCDAPIPSLVSSTPATCFGDNDGDMNLSAIGGSGGGYTYELLGQTNTSGIFSNLAAGSYDVLVTDDANCGIFYTVEISQPDSLALTPVVESEISCFGFNDGSLTVAVENGFAPFSFSWDNVPGDSVLVNVSQGDYEVVVTDVNGCFSSEIISISQPVELNVETDSTLVDCFGNATGTASVITSGGTMPYAFQWDNSTGGQITATATNLLAGNYAVTVTDANLCEVISNLEVTQPEVLEASAEFSNPLCFEASDGLIEITTSGGTQGYTYAWDNGLPDNALANNLQAGNFNVTVLDQNDCFVELSITLEDPEPIVLETQQQDVSCFGGNNGSITVSNMGVVGTPAYNWDNGSTAQNLSNLTAGQYCLTVTDGNNCEAQECISIDQPTALLASLSPQNISCDDDDDGAIDLTISGGVGPYVFNWSNGSTEEDLSGLVVGEYTVTVTDMNDCLINESVNLEQSSPLFTLDLDANSVDCFGESTGSAGVTVNGIASNPSFVWLGPNNYQSALQNIVNVPAGSYQVSVEDEFGCEVSGEIVIPEPEDLFGELVIEDVSCFGLGDGYVSILTSGGTSPYLYSLDGGGNFSTAALFGNLSGGEYSVIIQDANGCEWPQNFTVNEPEEIIIDVENIAEIILGETYGFEAQVNIPNSEIDTIIWTPTDSLSCDNCLTTTANPEYTTSYTIRLFTQDGCSAQAFTTLFVDRRISVFVPNAFSPNGDGINDLLSIYAAETNIKRIKSFQVFDRWGANVFYVEDFLPNDPNIGWDGTFRGKYLNPAVFTWIAEIELSDGRIALFQGDVAIVR